MEKIISAYLKSLNIPVSKGYCEKLIASHPDYPSLLSIADTLERLGIAHQAARVELHELEEIHFPFILHFDRRGGELVLINDQNDLKAREADFEQWDGVIVRAEPADTIADMENQKHLADERFLHATLTVGLAAVGVLLFVPAAQVFSWLYAALLITALAGAITGYFLVAKEMGITYRAVEAFCNTGTGAGCDRILTSENAKLFGRVTFSDAAMSYFVFQLVVLGSLVPLLEGTATFLLALPVVSLFAVPVVLYSLYYQAIKAKTWCRLCLVVDGLLIGQVALFGYMFSRGLIQPGAVEVLSLLLFGALFLATGASVLLIKHLLEKTNAARQAEVRANRIKYTPEVFTHLLSQSKRADTTLFEHEILLGSRDAPINITMTANLYCHPCKLGFEPASQLVDAYPNRVGLSIRLLHSGKSNGQHPPASRYLLGWWLHHVYGKVDEPARTKELIRDWYEEMNIVGFMGKYPPGGILDDGSADELETQHSDWFERERIHKTPTWFINGYELPEAYHIADLMEMVPGLAESFSSIMRKEHVVNMIK